MYLCIEHNIKPMCLICLQVISVLKELITEFNSRFKDFYILKPKFDLFNNPMTVDISIQPSDFQMELCDL